MQEVPPPLFANRGGGSARILPHESWRLTLPFYTLSYHPAMRISKWHSYIYDRTTTTSLGSPTSSPGTLQKRSVVDITMKITEAAEDIFLFGSGQYHERPAKRRRLDPKTGQPHDANGGAPLPDFQLNGEAVWHYAQASPSRLDNDDSWRSLFYGLGCLSCPLRKVFVNPIRLARRLGTVFVTLAALTQVRPSARSIRCNINSLC